MRGRIVAATCAARVGHIFRNGTEVAVVAQLYLDCIHELVSIIFIVFIGNNANGLRGASAYQHAVAAGQAGPCMHEVVQFCSTSISHAYISQLTSLYCSHFPNDKLTDKRSCTRSPWDGRCIVFLCIAIFLEPMHEAVKLLENVSEEQKIQL